ncbi:MAG: hypothetical protein J3T61_12575 [Candidatus Brocadiales bacterium]|nr:hypothetical protein [Candidatus Bathyanammoxibius sp.]
MEITVMNVYPHPCTTSFEYGSFKIDAAPEDGFSLLKIVEYHHPQGWGYGAGFSKNPVPEWDEQKGQQKMFYRPITATEIAQNIVREHQKVGVTVLAGEQPTGEELTAARERMEKFYLALIEVADKEWVRLGQQPGVISPLAIEAGKYLKRKGHPVLTVRREWLERTGVTAPRGTQDCPVCGEEIKQGVLKCAKCGEFVDREKAIELGYLKPTTPRRGAMSSALVEGHQTEQKETRPEGD